VSSEEGRWPGVTFEIDLEPGLPTVTADRHTEQVVRNLLSNAAKYGGTGSTVTIVADPARARSSSACSTMGLASRPTTNRLFEVLPLARHGRFGIRRRDRPVRVRALDRRDGRTHLGGSAPEGGAEFGFALTELEE
jgi:hypothetical protein